MKNCDVEKALKNMYMAQDILFSQLQDPNAVCREIAEGLDCLFRAIEIAEKPDDLFHFCPECESISFELREDDRLVCLSCDREWSETFAKEACQ